MKRTEIGDVGTIMTTGRVNFYDLETYSRFHTSRGLGFVVDHAEFLAFQLLRFGRLLGMRNVGKHLAL